MKYANKDTKAAVDAMKDSFKQILSYANLDEKRAKEITKLIVDFNNLVDKTSTEDNIRLLRRKIAEGFYDLYEKVFFKAYKDENVSRVIELFLKYGFLDENLLTKDQCIELYYLEDEND